MKPFKFSLRRVRLNSGGYTDQGVYYGLGKPLYVASADDGSDDYRGDWPMDIYIRAENRADARAQISESYPGSRFYR